jgi:hypothetical protein
MGQQDVQRKEDVRINECSSTVLEFVVDGLESCREMSAYINCSNAQNLSKVSR